MSDNQIFNADKISIVEFKLLKGQVNTPDDFAIENVEGHHLENSLELGFNIQDKLVKADFFTNITTESNGNNDSEATGNFHLMFIFYVENLDELAIPDKNNLLNLNPQLGNAISSVTYSTSRGILITRLQGTALQNFILPVINPNQLLHHHKK